MAAAVWAIIVLLVVVWFFGYVIAHIGGAFINLLLLFALVLLVWNLLFYPRSV
jgi:hypothetical protein